MTRCALTLRCGGEHGKGVAARNGGAATRGVGVREGLAQRGSHRAEHRRERHALRGPLALARRQRPRSVRRAPQRSAHDGRAAHPAVGGKRTQRVESKGKPSVPFCSRRIALSPRAAQRSKRVEQCDELRRVAASPRAAVDWTRRLPLPFTGAEIVVVPRPVGGDRFLPDGAVRRDDWG